jgi:hypothetical protein
VRAYSPVFTTLLQIPIDKLAAEELVAIIADVSPITPAVVYALTTPGNVPTVVVPQVDEVLARIPVHPVPIPKTPWGLIFVVPPFTGVRSRTGANMVVTSEGLDRVAPLALREEVPVFGTLDLSSPLPPALVLLCAFIPP